MNRKLITNLTLILGLVLITGCASTTVSNRQEYRGAKLPYPKRILIYDFAATRADIPPWAAGAQRTDVAEPEQTAEQVAAGRKLGSQTAQELVSQVKAMGLPAVQVDSSTPMQEGDYGIVGYFGSVEEGSAVERVVLGFGAGAASLKTRVEGYQMTPTGPRQLGGGQVDSGDSKGPGLIVPLAVTAITANPIGLVVGGAVKAGQELSGEDTIEGASRRTADEVAKQLKGAFKRQGWI